ncbi:MFS transporter [Rhizomonospora bruguierae]|uniref:MFS transporter n=1 Tax=Rhizomonospora bruguierae TaxID=1581705 RepID=UPI001BCF5329|nr:MFS transporter [Micromonospora sp. NBRC 107566]
MTTTRPSASPDTVPAGPPAPTPAATVPPHLARVRRRTLALLFGTQVIGGVGVTLGISVGALLAARLGGAGISGLAGSSSVIGGALLAIPVTRLTQSRGRRPALALAYLCGAAGALVVVGGAALRSVSLVLAGMLLFGGGSAAGLQARYAAMDLSPPGRRGRDLSLIVWATTLGAVSAPNFAALADATTRPLGVPPLSGPFALSAVAFALSALTLLALLRPDPLRLATPAAAAPGTRRTGVRSALPVVARRPAARLGIAAVAVGHAVMVGVMSMTPVRIGESHGDADVLRVVGLVLSLHIAGMYALSPLVGVLSDRLGRRAVILGGVTLLVAACAVAGTAGHDTVRLGVGLVLLGLGWSGTMVAGSTLLSESVPPPDRPAAQGLTDLSMGLAGALAGALGGFVVHAAGYPTLTLLAALVTVPLVALALRPVPPVEEE